MTVTVNCRFAVEETHTYVIRANSFTKRIEILSNVFIVSMCVRTLNVVCHRQENSKTREERRSLLLISYDSWSTVL